MARVFVSGKPMLVGKAYP